MRRVKRANDGGLVYHVFNRANARSRLSENEANDAAIERVLCEAGAVLDSG